MTNDNGKAQPSIRRKNPNVTIKHLAAHLGVSITTVSRALNGYADVGPATRERVAEAAQKLGYRPNRNAQRLVTQRTHNIAWVQPDNERKFLDPHFVEVMAGVLKGAREARYDIVMTSDAEDNEVAVYERYVSDNSVDGFIVDLPGEDDARINYLLSTGRPFVVHGRTSRYRDYAWVDIDNYGNFYRLGRLLAAQGHRRIALINGDERFNYALYRRKAIEDALEDAGMPPESLLVLNSNHPMGDAGFRLTSQVLEEDVSAIVYCSILMAVEGHAALAKAGPRGEAMVLASMDDQLHYLDLSQIADRTIFVRSSLKEAGVALIEELARQCDEHTGPQGTIVPSVFVVPEGMDGHGLDADLPGHRVGF